MLLSHVIRTWRVWLRYRVCVRQLSALNDMELADIGVSRSGIHWIAWRASRDGTADTSSIRGSDSNDR